MSIRYPKSDHRAVYCERTGDSCLRLFGLLPCDLELPMLCIFRPRLVGFYLALTLLLAACSPGGLFSGDLMFAPHRPIEDDPTLALSAAESMIKGFGEGQIALSEAEVSNILRLRWFGNPDAERSVKDVAVWFEQDRVFVKVLLAAGVVQGIPGEAALNFEGRLLTDAGGKLQFAVERTGLGVIEIPPPVAFDLLGADLNEILAFQAALPGGDVTVEPGTLVIDLQ
jgi:hypothetical protein